MSGRDVAYVVRCHIKALEMADTYTDDYYNHKYQERELARRVQVSPKGSLVAPQWVENKEHIAARALHMRRDTSAVTQKWEESNRVLGHYEKTNVKTPKPMLSVMPGGAMSSASQRPVFASALWVARGAVDKGIDALLELEEASNLAAHHGDDRLPALQDAVRAHLETLSRAVCHAQPHAFDVSEEGVAAALSPKGACSQQVRVAEPLSRRATAEVYTLDALLSLPKGVKFLARFAKAAPNTAAASSLLASACGTLLQPTRAHVFQGYDDVLLATLAAHDFCHRVPLPFLLDAADQLAKRTGTAPLETLARAVADAADARCDAQQLTRRQAAPPTIEQLARWTALRPKLLPAC